MTSIFVWKAPTQNTSKKMVRYYSGSNWALEDNEFSSKSFLFLEQTVISGFGDSVIIFHAKKMPQDWVGGNLLEVTQIPYLKVKEDEYGILEHIGEWFRFTPKSPVSLDDSSLQSELEVIEKWIHTSTKEKVVSSKPDVQKIHLDFQQFLIKYSAPLHQHNRHNNMEGHHNQHYNKGFRNGYPNKKQRATPIS